MNNEDMSDIIQKLSSMMNQSNNEANNQQTSKNDVSSDSNGFNEDTFKNLINSFASSNQSENTNNNESNNQDSDNGFNFDMNTILKMKTVMDKMNSKKNDPRANLLLSLKPYLNENRKEKLDQYMQFLNISKIIEAFNSDGGVNSK